MPWLAGFRSSGQLQAPVWLRGLVRRLHYAGKHVSPGSRTWAGATNHRCGRFQGFHIAYKTPHPCLDMPHPCAAAARHLLRTTAHYCALLRTVRTVQCCPLAPTWASGHLGTCVTFANTGVQRHETDPTQGMPMRARHRTTRFQERWAVRGIRAWRLELRCFLSPSLPSHLPSSPPILAA